MRPRTTSWTIDQLAVAAALCATPLSIAISEIFLTAALLVRLFHLTRGQDSLTLPAVFKPWLLLAILEIAVWLYSPDRAAGKGEMRHLLLIAALFVVYTCLGRIEQMLTIWRLIFATATVGSLALIVGFSTRVARYRHELATGGDPSFYLRSGGLLHHWMIFASVEILVFAALLEFRAAADRADRRWLNLALAVNSPAILLSLTRALWLACFLVVVLHLVLQRSKWLWAVPLVPAAVFLLIPGPVHQRINQSLQPDYYSNAERLQMWRVGWNIIQQHPIVGIGPGRVEEQYTRYLRPGEPVPAYHGHLHNNAIQFAAQFGLVVLAAALLCLAVFLRDLRRSYRRAATSDGRLLCRVALLGVTGFLVIGLMDYNYGHSLALILLTFTAVSPLTHRQRTQQVLGLRDETRVSNPVNAR